MVYSYPLKGIIESRVLESIFREINTAVKNDLPLSLQMDMIIAARKDFFEQVHEKEELIHNFTRRFLHKFSPQGYDLTWSVIGECPNCGEQEKGRMIEVTSVSNFLRKTDEQRTTEYLPVCMTCEEVAQPVKSFFGYIPHNKDTVLCVEARLKESSDKITDRILETDVGREDAIPNKLKGVVQDVFGARAILHNDVDLYDPETLEAICSNVSEIMDETLVPQFKAYLGEGTKSNSYEAIHAIGQMTEENSGKSSIIEVQMRTAAMNKKAEHPTSPAYHGLRASKQRQIRENTPRWQEVNQIVRQIISPDYLFSGSWE